MENSFKATVKTLKKQRLIGQILKFNPALLVFSKSVIDKIMNFPLKKNILFRKRPKDWDKSSHIDPPKKSWQNRNGNIAV
jgi:hypothetical protein